MKLKNIILCVTILLAFSAMNDVMGQWAANGNNVYNSNTGNVGIGNSSPSTLLYVAKNMTEPAVTVRNLGGTGGATYSMIDDASGANWKFKVTSTGGFKIRDHANALDVLTIESNSAANALYINATGSVGLGTASPSASAALDISNLTEGFLPPRMTSQQISMISNPANGLVVYNTSDEHLYVYSSQSTSWKRVSYDDGLIFPFPFLCTPFTITHVAGDVAPVTKTVTYGTAPIISIDYQCWITQNLGADHQATSVDDATEPSAGWYWQFNRKQGYKHDGTIRTPNTEWIVGINENSEWLAANDPCAIELGTGWHVPTHYELQMADDWNDWSDAWNSELKMHAAGSLGGLFENDPGELLGRGTEGYYWNKDQLDNDGFRLFFTSYYCQIGIYEKSSGYSIRCLKSM
jgi:hypothetical protein